MIDKSAQEIVWYAMQTTYKREMQAKAYLESRGIECFVPMQQSCLIKAGRKVTTLRPAVYNLIFVKVDATQLTDIKISLSYLHNLLVREDEKLIPIIIPTAQMDQFIGAVTHSLNRITYIDIATARLEKGTLVRIIGGDFEGYEGVLEKIKGKRDRRVKINVGDVIAYQIDVDANLIEKI